MLLARVLLFLSWLPLLAVSVPACSADGSSTVSEERKRELERYWELYQANDPAWPAARDRWYAYGGAERRTLVDSLTRDLLVRADQARKTERGLAPAWKRSQEQILALGPDETVPLLIGALRKFKDPASAECVADTLASFGAVEQVLEALDRPQAGDSAQFPALAVRVLVRIGGERAVERVGRELAGNADWQVRATAAEALRDARSSDRDRAARALIGGLEDDDPFVVRQVLASLVALDYTRAAPVVAVMLDEATRAGDTERVKLAVEALRSLTGARVDGDDPVLWRREAEHAAADAARREGST
jgi:hypothetical protein